METIIMFGLAILFVLLVAMFLFFRQKMAYYEVRLELLSDTVQTMAGITRSSLQESSDSDCSESESESESEYSPKIINLPIHLPYNEPIQKAEVIEDVIEDGKNEIDIDLEVMEVLDVPNTPTTEELIVVSDDETKKIELPTEFDNLSVKELKEKVAELNGPKLKTKKELIQFLQNKI